MPDTTSEPPKRKTIYIWIGNVASWVSVVTFIVLVIVELFDPPKLTNGTLDRGRFILGATIPSVIVGLGLWGIVSAIVYIVRYKRTEPPH